jgi:predicted DNA-binding transcriptional regulator AlpA
MAKSLRRRAGTMSPAADQGGAGALARPPSVAVEPGQDRVLNMRETAAFIGLHIRTLRRLGRDGEAPPRVQLSERRFGVRLSSIMRWLDERAERACPKDAA